MSVPYLSNDNVDDADADASNEIQNLLVSESGDTLYISNGNWIIVPGISNANTVTSGQSVQSRLNASETPINIFNSGISLDSIYGKTYQGGIIGYLDTINGTGLIAFPWDSGDDIDQQFCSSPTITGASSTEIGDGNQNTIAIESFCTAPNTAADICANLDYNGYDDWFLPSAYELNELWKNLADSDGDNFSSGISDPNNKSSFYDDFYWSSTVITGNYAWAQGFATGTFQGNIGQSGRVRAVRYF